MHLYIPKETRRIHYLETNLNDSWIYSVNVA